MFDNKKKRVDKIFDDSDSEDTAVNNVMNSKSVSVDMNRN